MQYTTLKPKQIKEGIIAGASLDLQFFTNALGTRTSRYVYDGCIVRNPVAYKIIQELELEGIDTDAGCAYIVPMKYTVMVAHYGKHPQELYTSESQIDAEDRMRDQVEVLKSHHKRWGVINGMFVIFGKDDIFKTTIWIKKERKYA